MDKDMPRIGCVQHDCDKCQKEQSDLAKVTKQRDDLVAALKKYQAAGFGNSTDFAKQGEAYDAAIEVLTSVEEGK